MSTANAVRAALDRYANRLHLLIALACAWLVLSSPWIGMYRWIPDEPGLLNLSHVVLGFAMLPLGLVYLVACAQGGRWRLYFPWLAGEFGATVADLAGMLRGQRPASEGGGLFALIEGVLLLALLAAGLTGALWSFMQDSELTLLWRGHHILAARVFAGLLLLHVVAVALHLLDLVRD